MRRVLPVLTAAAFCAPAHAQTIDGQGAAQLSETLAHYVSKTAFDKGIVKVATDGDAYKIAVDFKALAALFPIRDGIRVDIAPYAMRVKPRADGKWQVDGDIFPNGLVEVSNLPDKMHVEWSITDGKMTGVYDPELATFASASATNGGIRLVTKDQLSQNETAYGPGSLTMTASKSANGGADYSVKQVFSSYVASTMVQDPGTSTNFPITMKAASLTNDATGTGVKTRSFLDLLAFGIANASEEKIKANQAELKTLVTAALPLWQRMDGIYTLSDFSLQTPFGGMQAGKAGLAFGMDGVQQNASVTYAIDFSDVKVVSLFMPSWVPSLVPTDIDLNLSGTNLNLDSPTKKAIAAFDLNQEPPIPDRVGEEIAMEFVANGPKIVMGKSTIKNAGTTITLEGEMTFPDAEPVLNATIDATGFDKIVTSLQTAAATDPEVGEALQAALLARGFGKALPDGRLEWAVNIKADGSAFINGTMVKPADPVSAPQQ